MFYSAPRLTMHDKRNLSERFVPDHYRPAGMVTVDFNFIRCDYINAFAVGEPILTVTKWVHNKTVVLTKHADGSFTINPWDSVTTRKKLGMVLPAGLGLTTVKGEQWLRDSRSCAGDWDKTQWHRVDGDLTIDTAGNVHGGDAWAVGSSILKRTMVEAEPVRFTA